MGLKGEFGGQVTVLGLEDQSEGPGVTRDEDEGTRESTGRILAALCRPPVAIMFSCLYNIFRLLVQSKYSQQN